MGSRPAEGSTGSRCPPTTPARVVRSAKVVLSAIGVTSIAHDEGEAYWTRSFTLSYIGALKWTSPSAHFSSNIGGMSGDHLELELDHGNRVLDLDHGNRVLVVTTGWYGRGSDPEDVVRTNRSSTLPSLWDEGTMAHPRGSASSAFFLGGCVPSAS